MLTARLARPARGTIVNDVHSSLNATTVSGVERPESIHELRAIVATAAASGRPVSFCGGRHAMGGQQFASDALLVDTTALSRVVDFDAERGLVTVEAGIDWPRLISHLLWASAGQPQAWSIIQKQTGADRLTIGGALSANIHGRGLRLRPFVGDIESFDLVDACGDLRRCSRAVNPDLFSLAIGGYGLFGPIARVTLRLAPRRKVERRVAIAGVDDLPELFARRMDAGFEYGDFQFAIDPAAKAFLRTGVLSCYRRVDDETRIPEKQLTLTSEDWQRLLRLAHTNKSRAFAEYAGYYVATDGQIYWSDTFQLSDYTDGYHTAIDRETHAHAPGSEMISELFVPRSRLPAFMSAVRDDARCHGTNVIYGTIRLIERDPETALAWAREPWACVIFNLHVDHTPDGILHARDDFRRLIDRAIEQDGSYYLTYHRWARRDQVDACHPRLREVLALKRHHDPQQLFVSDWYRHHCRLFGMDESVEPSSYGAPGFSLASESLNAELTSLRQGYGGPPERFARRRKLGAPYVSWSAIKEVR